MRYNPESHITTRLNDWLLTVEIKGSTNAVLVSRRILSYMLAQTKVDTLPILDDKVEIPCRVSITAIGRTLSIPPATVARGLQRLRDQGLIRRWMQSEYVINLFGGAEEEESN